MITAEARLAQILESSPLAAQDAAPDSQAAFQDSDGLISFVNMASTVAQKAPNFTTGQNLCDSACNFFATLRPKVFAYLKENPTEVVPGDVAPTKQWDPAVTHYIQTLLTEAGGFTANKWLTQTYSNTQYITEFSTTFVKLLFDAVAFPAGLIDDVTSFLQGVGESLRSSWDNRSRVFATSVLAQCHEAVPVGPNPDQVVYYPKVKYYYLTVDSSQRAFTTAGCRYEQLTLNFTYSYYVTGLAAALLDKTSDTYARFTGFLSQAQEVQYKNAKNNLSAVLSGVVSSPAPAMMSVAEDAETVRLHLAQYPSIPAELSTR